MNVTVGPQILPNMIRAGGGYPSSGALNTLAFKEASGTATAAASFNISVGVPINCKILAVSLRVDTALTSSNGGTDFTAAFTGGFLGTIATVGAFAKNTKIDLFFDTIGSQTTATANITITCNNSKLFSAGGVVHALVYYQTITSLSSV